MQNKEKTIGAIRRGQHYHAVVNEKTSQSWRLRDVQADSPKQLRGLGRVRDLCLGVESVSTHMQTFELDSSLTYYQTYQTLKALSARQLGVSVDDILIDYYALGKAEHKNSYRVITCMHALVEPGFDIIDVDVFAAARTLPYCNNTFLQDSYGLVLVHKTSIAFSVWQEQQLIYLKHETDSQESIHSLRRIWQLFCHDACYRPLPNLYLCGGELERVHIAARFCDEIHARATILSLNTHFFDTTQLSTTSTELLDLVGLTLWRQA